MVQERRRWPRRSVAVQCRIEGLSTRVSVRLSELSIGGGYVDGNTTLKVGDPVALVLMLEGTEVPVSGTVLYVHAGMGFGFAFDVVDMPAATRQQIAEFLRSSAEGRV